VYPTPGLYRRSGTQMYNIIKTESHSSKFIINLAHRTFLSPRFQIAALTLFFFRFSGGGAPNTEINVASICAPLLIHTLILYSNENNCKKVRRSSHCPHCFFFCTGNNVYKIAATRKLRDSSLRITEQKHSRLLHFPSNSTAMIQHDNMPCIRLVS
jgi:hypothetical protein